MIILDTVGDTIEAEASAATSVTITLYGIETSSGTDTYKKLGQSQLTGSGTQDVLYTVPADTSTICSVIIIANTASDSKNINLWHVPNGDSYGDDNALFKALTIEGNTSVVWNKGNLQQLPDPSASGSNYIESNPTSGQYRITGLRRAADGQIVVTYDGTPEP